MQVLFRRAGAVTLVTALLVVAACSDKDEPTAPTTERVAGSYAATRLTATSPLGTEDLLQQGGSLTIEFLRSGTLTGNVSAPKQGVTNLPFAGTWRIENGEVEIDDVGADTFVEDLSFRVVGNTLVADEIIDVVRVQATLTKR